MTQLLAREPYVPRLECLHQGKVRDMNLVPDVSIGKPRTRLKKPTLRLMTATDSVSTHNIVHLSPVPTKGQLLTAMQLAWVLLTPLQRVPTHIAAYGRDIYTYLPGDPKDYPSDLHLRAIVIHAADVTPVEFIHRAYMSGSLYHKFYKNNIPNPYDLELPRGLQLMSPFKEPVHTSTAKSENDEELPTDDVEADYPEESAFSREVYDMARAFALERGIEIVDSKKEIGWVPVHGSAPCLVDEWFTGDCCRFADAKKIRIGQEPEWFDKQILRDEAERIWGDGPKQPLKFNFGAIEQTVKAYHLLFERLFGMTLFEFQEKYLEAEHQPIEFARPA